MMREKEAAVYYGQRMATAWTYGIFFGFQIIILGQLHYFPQVPESSSALANVLFWLFAFFAHFVFVTWLFVWRVGGPPGKGRDILRKLWKPPLGALATHAYVVVVWWETLFSLIILIVAAVDLNHADVCLATIVFFMPFHIALYLWSSVDWTHLEMQRRLRLAS